MNVNERHIWGCSCGANHYLDVGIFGDGDDDWLFSITTTDWPASFWQRVKRLFKREACQYEILLRPTQAGELAAVLGSVCKKHEGDHPLSTLVEDKREWKGTSAISTWKLPI